MISVLAPAKLNLFLHITGKRADGYHFLDSLVVFTEFGDVVQARPAAQLSLEIVGEFAGAIAHELPEKNLVWKAAEVLQAFLPTPHGAHITLHKNIPVGAGIGGGSADAAAALHALMKLWNISLNVEILNTLALRLGADVPVCLHGAPCMMRGVGERVTAVAMNDDIYVLLVNPRMPLSTPDVFKAYKNGFLAEGELPNAHASLLDYILSRTNMLTDAAVEKLPVIADILAAINATHHCIASRMSGSGATCFGLYKTQADADAAREKIYASHPHWWMQTTKILKESVHGKAQ